VGLLAGARLVLTVRLLGPAEIRSLTDQLGIRPAKSLGQSFLHDGNTVRRIVRTAGVGPGDAVLEVGPGLGSLTLGLLGAGASVVAVEIDPVLAGQLATTVGAYAPDDADRLRVVVADALALATSPAPAPTALVANLPYSVAVPVLLHVLEVLPSLRTALIMLQAEVADRLVAGPGSRVYGVPSVKTAWYAKAERAGAVPRTVFWPVPNVDSGLVRLTRRDPPPLGPGATREDVFAVVDCAFGQRRKMLRSALAPLAGSPAAAEAWVRAAEVDPRARGETLSVADYARLATVAADLRRRMH
jgi:16S rRNA (adenine1518-N6/adenine1519-N6)-dimethyltransferase